TARQPSAFRMSPAATERANASVIFSSVRSFLLMQEVSAADPADLEPDPRRRNSPPEIRGPSHRGSGSVLFEQALHDPDEAGTDDDHEERGQDAEDQREHDLDRRLLGLGLGGLTALDPQLARLGAQNARDADTEHV